MRVEAVMVECAMILFFFTSIRNSPSYSPSWHPYLLYYTPGTLFNVVIDVVIIITLMTIITITGAIVNHV